MNCETFRNDLAVWLREGLTATDHREVEAHLQRCPACRLEMERAMAGDDLASTPPASPTSPTSPIIPAIQPAPDLASAIAAKTMGSPCSRSESRLVSLMEGDLDDVDRELLGHHLAYCESCRSLQSVLAEVSRDLPILATLSPDPAFVDKVLRATLPHKTSIRHKVAGWLAGLGSISGRLHTGHAHTGHSPRGRSHAVHAHSGRAWWDRPRFALESAYLVTLLAFVVMWPNQSVTNDAMRFLDRTWLTATGQVRWLGDQLGALGTGASNFGGYTLAHSRALVRESWTRLGENASTQLQRAETRAMSLGRELSQFWAESRDKIEVGLGL